MNELKDQTIVKLNDVEHLKLRPQLYIGSVSLNDIEGYFIENESFTWKKVSYVPGLFKILNEILDNSVDEAVRTSFKFANKIDVFVNNDTVSIKDSGRGIPINKNAKNNDEQPTYLAFCHARAGSNFMDDANRVTQGCHGIGSFASNVFSTYFNVETSNGKDKVILTCLNNMETSDIRLLPSSGSSFTKVTFKPDLKRFGIIEENIPSVYIDLIKQRLINLSMTFKQIAFTFNGYPIGIKKVEDFVKMFGEASEIYNENKKYFFAVLPNQFDDFKFYTYSNGLYLKEGGTHIQYITDKIVEGLKEKIGKKYKEIKPGDIKNKLMIVVFLNEFANMKFDSQTKERLTNSNSEIKEYFGEIDFEKFNTRVYKNGSISEPIIETYRIKEEFKKRQELKKMNKDVKKVVSDKYMAPTGSKEFCVFSEGLSAGGGICKALGREKFGYFALKGKPLNTLEVKLDKIINNEEFETIVNILDLDMSDANTTMSYKNILIASDFDLDGISIRLLLLTFFYKFCPKILKEGRIKFLKTPMIIVFTKKGEIFKLLYSFEEYKEFCSKYNVDDYKYNYYKGLGTFENGELEKIFSKFGFENFVVTFNYTDQSEKAIKDWMAKNNADIRKLMVKGKSFNIDVL